MSGYSVNGFEIYSIINNKLEKIIEKKLTNWGIDDVRWLTNNKFYFKRYYGIDGKFEYCYAELNF